MEQGEIFDRMRRDFRQKGKKFLTEQGEIFERTGAEFDNGEGRIFDRMKTEQGEFVHTTGRNF